MEQGTKIQDVAIEYHGEPLTADEHVRVLRYLDRRGPGRYSVIKESGRSDKDNMIHTTVSVRRIGDYAKEA